MFISSCKFPTGYIRAVNFRQLINMVGAVTTVGKTGNSLLRQWVCSVETQHQPTYADYCDNSLFITQLFLKTPSHDVHSNFARRVPAEY